MLDSPKSPKEIRRQLILDTMRGLLSEKPEEDISAGELARLCNVSTPTIYNLAGTRDQMLAALIGEFVAELDDRVNQLGLGRPLETAAKAVDISTDLLLEQGPVYRRILRRLGQADGSMADGATRRSVNLQSRLMKAAQDQGRLLHTQDAFQIGRLVVLNYNGTMAAWARNILSDGQFRIQSQYGFLVTVAAFASDNLRPEILKKIRRLSRHLPADPS